MGIPVCAFNDDLVVLNDIFISCYLSFVQIENLVRYRTSYVHVPNSIVLFAWMVSTAVCVFCIIIVKNN